MGTSALLAGEPVAVAATVVLAAAAGWIGVSVAAPRRSLVYESFLAFDGDELTWFGVGVRVVGRLAVLALVVGAAQFLAGVAGTVVVLASCVVGYAYVEHRWGDGAGADDCD